MEPRAVSFRNLGVRAAPCWAMWLVGALACSREPEIAPPAPPPPPIAAERLAAQTEGNSFSNAVRELQGILNLLARTPPLDDGTGLRRAIELLGTAIDTAPGPARPARTEGAKLMRSREFDVWVSSIREDAPAKDVLEVLQIAAGALAATAAADGGVSEVKSAVDRFQRAVDAVDGSAALTHERDHVIAALREAVAALKTIDSAAATSAPRDAGLTTGAASDR